MNDPFDGGMHLQDIFVFKPVHLDGELIGFACTTAHHGDVGGRLPGSSACDNTEIFQEGIRLPWLRLYAEGEPVEDVFKIIEANVRIPRMTFGDLGAQVAACSVAERALVALAERHGAEPLAELMDALIDYTERLVRQEIATWPDGTATFTDYLDSDGIDVRDVPITAHVTIAGDEVTADLTDSAPMVRGSLNSTRSFVQACVYQAVRSALTVEMPNTAGAFRPIHVLTKPGTVAEVVMPGASSMRGVTGFRVVDAVSGALAQLIPDRVPAAGEGGNTLAIFGAERPDGGSLHLLRARRRHLGRHAGGRRQRRPHEPGEPRREHPGRGRRGRVPDRGRAVRARPRLGRRRPPPRRARDRARLALPDAETSLIVRSDRAKHPPYGLAGGGPGALSANCCCAPTAARRRCRRCSRSRSRRATSTSTGRRAAAAGATRSSATPPRSPTTSLNEKVSSEAALALYGVVVDARRQRGEERCVIAKADAVVIGGGIIGASVAHFLTKLGYGRVALVEKSGICGGSTQYSAAHVRQHYSNEVAIRLAVRGAGMFANAEEELGGPVGFVQHGYMVIAPEEQAHAIRDVVPVQQRFGVQTEILDARGGRRTAGRSSTSKASRSRASSGRLATPIPFGRCTSLVRSAQRDGPRGARGLRGARHLDRRRPRHRRRHGRRHDRHRRRRQRARPVGRPRSAGWSGSTTRSPSAASTRRSSRPPTASARFPVMSDATQQLYFRHYGEGKVLVGEGWPKQTEPADPESYDDGTDDEHLARMVPRLVRRLPALAATLGHRRLRRHLRDRLLRRLRHHRGLVSDRRRGGGRRLLLRLRRQRPLLQARPGDRRVARGTSSRAASRRSTSRACPARASPRGARSAPSGGRATARETLLDPDHVRGDPQRARRGDRRDGADAAPQRLLHQHQDALRLLVRVLRRRAPRRRAGLHPAGPPRLDGRAGAARVLDYGAENLEPGDVIITNDPFPSGVHLNDISLISPVHHDGELLGYVANLAHHVDVGGGAPASIGAFREVFQEGVIIPPVKVVEGGRIVDDVFDLILAQIRSKHETARRLPRPDRRQRDRRAPRSRRSSSGTAARRSPAAMRELLDYTERRTRAELAALPHGVYEAEGSVDTDGYTDEPVRLRARIEIARGRRRLRPGRLRPAAPRAGQLHLRADVLGLRVRAQVPDRPRPARQRRLLPPRQRSTRRRGR